MNPQLLYSLYPRDVLLRMFVNETGYVVDEIYVKEFQRWLENIQDLRLTHKSMPDLTVWVIEKMHQYTQIYC